MDSDRLNLGIFLATMEVSIVSTALVEITDELQAFNNSSWVINAYLSSFTGISWIVGCHRRLTASLCRVSDHLGPIQLCGRKEAFHRHGVYHIPRVLWSMRRSADSRTTVSAPRSQEDIYTQV